MSELYEIRPLEWQDHGRLSKCITMIGVFEVWQRSVGLWVFGSKLWNDPVTIETQCRSLDAGKLAAEAYYKSRLLTALKPVEAANAVDK